MQIVANFETTPALILRSYHACHPSAIPTRWGTAALGAALSLATRSFVPFALVIAFVYVLRSVGRHQLAKYLEGPRKVAIAIREDAYSVTGQEGTTRTVPWTSITSVVRRKGFFVLRVSWSKAIAFPETALDARQTSEFLEFLQRRNLPVR